MKDGHTPAGRNSSAFPPRKSMSWPAPTCGDSLKMWGRRSRAASVGTDAFARPAGKARVRPRPLNSSTELTTQKKALQRRISAPYKEGKDKKRQPPRQE